VCMPREDAWTTRSRTRNAGTLTGSVLYLEPPHLLKEVALLPAYSNPFGAFHLRMTSWGVAPPHAGCVAIRRSNWRALPSKREIYLVGNAHDAGCLRKRAALFLVCALLLAIVEKYCTCDVGGTVLYARAL